MSYRHYFAVIPKSTTKLIRHLSCEEVEETLGVTDVFFSEPSLFTELFEINNIPQELLDSPMSEPYFTNWDTCDITAKLTSRDAIERLIDVYDTRICEKYEGIIHKLNAAVKQGELPYEKDLFRSLMDLVLYVYSTSLNRLESSHKRVGQSMFLGYDACALINLLHSIDFDTFDVVIIGS